MTKLLFCKGHESHIELFLPVPEKVAAHALNDDRDQIGNFEKEKTLKYFFVIRTRFKQKVVI